MTDNDFSKAFKQCLNNESCIGCPLDHNDYASDCVSEIFKYCSDLAKRKDEMIEGLISGQETLQKFIAEKDAEIERLEKENKEIFDNYTQAVFLQTKRINEAVKEFAERLKKDLFYKCGDMNYTETCEARRLIDNLVKERVGEG